MSNFKGSENLWIGSGLRNATIEDEIARNPDDRPIRQRLLLCDRVTGSIRSNKCRHRVFSGVKLSRRINSSIRLRAVSAYAFESTQVVMLPAHYAGLLRVDRTPLAAAPPQYDPRYPQSGDVAARDLAVYERVANRRAAVGA